MLNENFGEWVWNLDARVSAFFVMVRDASTVQIFHWVTFLGAVSTVIVLAVVVSTILWLNHGRRQIVALWLAIVGSEGTTYIAKLIFHRPRPEAAVYLESSYSFPSGHATIAVAFYGFLTYLLLGRVRSRVLRLLIVLFSILMILSIGFSRLYLGVHYASDVLAGYLVGILFMMVGVTVVKHRLP